jgi:hypothetical protein
MIELGTKEYPYRSFRAVSSEILNQFSHQDLNVTIYLKGGTKVYIEDDTTYFINISKVTITSYSDNPLSLERALIVPTAIPQHGVSERAAFHLLNHTDLKVVDILSQNSYSDSLLAKLSVSKVTIKISETSFSLIDVDVYREEIDYNSESLFMFPIFLQNRDVVVSKPYLK